MPDEEDLRPVDLERRIDLDDRLLPGSPRLVAGGDLRLEEPRSPALGAFALELDLEGVQGERERSHRLGVDEAAAAPRVVLRDGVREPTALLDDDVSLPAKQSADGDRRQDAQQRDMKDEVAGLAKVALLSRHPARAELALRRPLNHPPAVPTKVGGRLSQRCIAIARHAGGDGAAEPLEIARGGRWRCEHRPPVLTGTRDDAADERDEQEQVDRGEPRRSEHVEEAQ